ncbi:hypothetical protein GF325_02270 [Candidatus Bathyarchaeota archaeon]|nr:hypothetical protein [Candidatus Bathyarchaeota archaeon]
MLRKVVTGANTSRFSCLIDGGHGEILDIFDDNFSELFHVLNDVLNIDVSINREETIPEEDLLATDILVLGCPKDFLVDHEIQEILKYIREGGNLLIISDAGGDLANETNLNDLLSNLHIELEPTMIRDKQVNMGSSLAPVIENLNLSHPIMRNVMRVVVGGGCTMSMEEPAVSLLSTSMTSWIERFHPDETEAWKVMKVGEHWSLMASVLHGQGKVIACGDVDMFSNDADYGINALDNHILVKNMFNWFLSPVESSTVIDWLISRIAVLEKKQERLEKMLKELLATNESLDQVDSVHRGGI